MRVRVDPSRGENHAFIPWKSENKLSPGRYSLGTDPMGALEIVIWEGETRKWQSGPWDSVIFTGIPDMLSQTLFMGLSSLLLLKEMVACTSRMFRQVALTYLGFRLGLMVW